MKMETSESVLKSPLQAGGIEVKLSVGKLTWYMLLLYLLFMFAGSAAYVYIWEDLSAYGLGHYIGEYWGRYALGAIFLVFIIYIPLQGLLLYFADGHRLGGLRWRCNWAGAGIYSRNPILLKNYRVTLLLPGILLGVLPALHGFCAGQSFVYIFGLVGIVCSMSDFTLWCRLRPFHDDDLYQAGRREFQGTIIKRNFVSDNI